MPLSPDARLRDAIARGIAVDATCPQGHAYRIDLDKLIALAGPYALLDHMLAKGSWCPHCGALASGVNIIVPDLPPAPPAEQ